MVGDSQLPSVGDVADDEPVPVRPVGGSDALHTASCRSVRLEGPTVEHGIGVMVQELLDDPP